MPAKRSNCFTKCNVLGLAVCVLRLEGVIASILCFRLGPRCQGIIVLMPEQLHIVLQCQIVPVVNVDITMVDVRASDGVKCECCMKSTVRNSE